MKTSKIESMLLDPGFDYLQPYFLPYDMEEMKRRLRDEG